jgi:hypothetical protein
MTYTVDGIRVPADYFMQLVDSAFHGSLGLVEAAAHPAQINYEDVKPIYGDSWNLNLLLTPQNSRPVPLQSTNELRDGFRKLLQNPKCKSFVDALITGAEGHVDQSLRLGLGFEDICSWTA